MWVCPNCESKNEESIRMCICCGEERSDKGKSSAGSSKPRAHKSSHAAASGRSDTSRDKASSGKASGSSFEPASFTGSKPADPSGPSAPAEKEETASPAPGGYNIFNLLLVIAVAAGFYLLKDRITVELEGWFSWVPAVSVILCCTGSRFLNGVGALANAVVFAFVLDTLESAYYTVPDNLQEFVYPTALVLVALSIFVGYHVRKKLPGKK